MQQFICNVIGDEGVGKSCMIMSFVKGVFPEDQAHVAHTDYTKNLMVDDKQVIRASCGILLPVYHEDTAVFIICYAVNHQISFDNMKVKWVPEIKVLYRDKPFLLVGTKTDTRDGPNRKLPSNRYISTDEGRKFAEEQGAYTFVECSALTGTNLKRVFDLAYRCYIHNKEVKEAKESIDTVYPSSNSLHQSTNEKFRKGCCIIF
eukprot:maker-scaffold_49-snap-gene-1.95-mRNA-1 protein AED:0.22 eAED:0.22 QI:0/0/0/0.5/0.66/0.75/4/0/203